MRLRSLLFAVFLFVFSLSMFGQSGDAQQPAGAAPEQTGQPAPGTGHYRARRLPTCWREAGISPSVVNERWHIEDNAKAKISGACTDSSLTAEQRLAKIHEIHQDTDAEIAKLMTAKQLSVLKACEAERDKQNTIRASRAGEKEKELGPCGGVIPSSGMSGHEHQH